MKTTKRLFSWLIVLAMVLSMVPVFGLPALAATEAEEEAAEPVRFPSNVESYEAECPVCKTTVTWKPYHGENYSEAAGIVLTGQAHFHLYLEKDETYGADKNFMASYRKVCFNLNGYNVTAEEGARAAFMTSQVLNMIDTYGGSVVTGDSNSYENGAALHMNGGNASATYNIYGGTYKKLAYNTLASIVRINVNGGTINWYDGVIDATGVTTLNANTGAAVGLSGNLKTTTNAETGDKTTTRNIATFNMYGGEIKGGSAVSGGNVQVGANGKTACAVFNLIGGKVIGGTAIDLLNEDGSVKTSGAGGNFSVHNGATLNISGGVIANGHVENTTSGSSWGGNIRCWNAYVNISGGLIYGGTGGPSGKLLGANVSVYSDAAAREAGYGVLNISGGTIVGDVATSNSNASTIKLSGAPVIVKSMEIDGETVKAISGGLVLANDANIDISALSPEAKIAISGVSVGRAFTAASDNAAAVAACFEQGNYQGKVFADNKIHLADKEIAGAANLTEEVYTKIANANKVDNSDAAIDAHVKAGTCPMCGATGITWEKRTAAVGGVNKVSNKAYHYYFDTTFSTGSNFVQMVKLDGVDSANNTVCVALKSTANITCTKYRVQIGGTNNVLNIMGTGTLKADQKSKDADLGLFQMDGSTLNLYGGTYLHENYGRAANYAVIRLQANSAVVNIYKDAKIGPASEDVTKAATNVTITGKGTLNMYGGVIRNGVAFTKEMSPNVNMTAAGTFNMYGGKIIGGHHQLDAEGNPIKVGDADINGTPSSIRIQNATVNMYGGTIEGGVSKNGGNGGAIYVGGTGVFNMSGGTLTGGRSTSYGGNIGGWTSGVVNISGTALIEKGYAPNGGGNIYIPNAKMTVNISGGFIRDGESKQGGNIMVNKNTNGGALNISGGEISGGYASSDGGNVYQTTGGIITITGGTIKDGEAAGLGGNLCLQTSMDIKGATISGGKAQRGGNIAYGTITLTLDKDTQILDGEATIDGGNLRTNSKAVLTSEATISGGKAQQFGGNISQGNGAEFIMNGGVLANGTITKATGGSHWGGNIRSWNGKITINDGLVYGGTGAISNISANNIGALGDDTSIQATLTINGGTIVGDVQTTGVSLNEDGSVKYPGTTLVITGAPKIVDSMEIDGQLVEATVGGLYIADGVVADISGLTADARIAMHGAAEGAKMTTAGSAEMAAVFTASAAQEKFFITQGEDGCFYLNFKGMGILDAEENETWYMDTAEAVAAYYAEGGFEKGQVLVVGASGQTITLAGDAYVDIAGQTATIAGSGKLFGLDRSNNNYKIYGLWTVGEGVELVNETVNPVNGNRYLAVQEGEQVGYHRFKIELTDVTLRTSNPGMYYKAAIKCDEVLRDLVDSYGVALSLNAVPGAELEQAGVLCTKYGQEDFAKLYENYGVTTNSGAIVGILKEKNTAAVNSENLNRKIYANAYITFNLGGETYTVVADTENAGKTAEAEEFTGVAYSLADILVAVNENWENYAEEDQATIGAFIMAWADKITEAAMGELMAKLDKIVAALG